MAVQVELSEDEILARYGGLLWDALRGFAEDPSYWASMCESANLIEYKRSLWDARAKAIAEANTPDDVPKITERILKERGVATPLRRRAA